MHTVILKKKWLTNLLNRWLLSAQDSAKCERASLVEFSAPDQNRPQSGHVNALAEQ